MESSSAMVPFPLLTTPIETTYRPCTIPYRFASDSPHKPTPAELAWIEVFRKSIPSFRKRAELDQSVPDAEVRSAKFAERYGQILDELEADPESHGGPPDCILLCRLREQCLRELGFRDIFKKVKDEENTKALTLFEKVVQVMDDIEDGGKRLENLIRGIFAGNIFDLGAAQLAEVFAKDGISFLASCENLLTRPWVIDDLDAFKLSWMRKSWRKAVIFVDNSGADIVLGILPFARELLRRGTQVILAANDLPSINDITYLELVEIISKVKEVKDGKEYILGVDANNLLVVNSGSDLPVASSSSPERNWSTYSIHSKKHNRLFYKKAKDLVFVHSNLQLLTQKENSYKQGETKQWILSQSMLSWMLQFPSLLHLELMMTMSHLMSKYNYFLF